MVYKFFDKRSKGGSVNIPLEFNEQLAKELHNPIITKFKKRKVYSGFKDQDESQTKYTLTKKVNFTIVLLKNG